MKATSTYAAVTIKGIFNGDTWKKWGNGISNWYSNAIDHDMENMDWERWENNYISAKNFVQNASAEDLGYAVGYGAGTILTTKAIGFGVGYVAKSTGFGVISGGIYNTKLQVSI